MRFLLHLFLRTSIARTPRIANRTKIAERAKNAYDAQLESGEHLTRDLGGASGTREFTDAIIARMQSG